MPPRGSPRVDRRTSAGSHKSAASPRATPSSGSPNYLNDKYFDTIQPNPNNLCRLTPQKLHKKNEPVSPPRTPIFRDRSPTCVRDWLEVNDFAASDYDENVLQFKISEPTKCVTIKPRKPLPIRTAILQRQSSFRAFSYSSDSSVRYKVEKYAEQGDAVDTKIAPNNDQNGISANIVSDLIKTYDCNLNVINDKNNNLNTSAGEPIVHPESMDIESAIEKGTIFKLRKTFEKSPSNGPNGAPPSAMPRKKKPKATLRAPQSQVNDQPDAILKTLKRKQAPSKPNAADQSDDITHKKSEILKSHSRILSVENMQYLDTFSLDGEFV